MDRGKILVVEDDEAIRAVMVELLELEGYRVAEARNGQEALDLLRGGLSPDLLLLDHDLPVLDGSEVLSRLPKVEGWAVPPTIVVTGGIRPRPPAAAALLRKPFSLTDLLGLVGRYSNACRAPGLTPAG